MSLHCSAQLEKFQRKHHVLTGQDSVEAAMRRGGTEVAGVPAPAAAAAAPAHNGHAGPPPPAPIIANVPPMVELEVKHAPEPAATAELRPMTAQFTATMVAPVPPPPVPVIPAAGPAPVSMAPPARPVRRNWTEILLDARFGANEHFVISSWMVLRVQPLPAGAAVPTQAAVAAASTWPPAPASPDRRSGSGDHAVTVASAVAAATAEVHKLQTALNERTQQVAALTHNLVRVVEYLAAQLQTSSNRLYLTPH